MAELAIPALAATELEEVPLDETGAICRHALALYDAYRDEIRPAPNWPGQRDLVEMLLRSLPEGGQGYPERVRAPEANGLTLDEDREDELIQEWVIQYFLSRNLPSIEALDPDEIFAVETLLSAALRYLDPICPVWESLTVHWMMTWYLPMVLDPATDQYDRGPTVFRNLSRFWHARHGIDYATTLSALATLKRHEQEYAALRHDPILARRRAAVQSTTHNADAKEWWSTTHPSPSA